MRLSTILLALFRFFTPPAIILTLGLYFYAPLLDCSFPVVRRAVPGCSIPGQERARIPEETAPFRLLAFGDPQLEGDTSLPPPDAPYFPRLNELGRRLKDWEVGEFEWKDAVKEVVLWDIPRHIYAARKRLDLWGNDLYLAHIYRTVFWWSQPTHVVVLGDLLGSQWIGNEEFKRRSDRFWKKVFKGAERVPRAITDSSGRAEVLGQDESWKRRIIAVAGNHDIGYAGDLDDHRIERFEETYGNVNWDIRFRLDNVSTSPGTEKSMPFGSQTLTPQDPELHLVILNTMNLDSPAYNEALQQQSRDFAESTLFHPSSNPNTATILLTHIPLHKPDGVCVDSEFFDWFPDDQGGGIKEQNFLLKGSSDYLLNGLTAHGSHQSAIVLNGHDHEGCDTYHFHPGQPGEGPWEAKHFNAAEEERQNEVLTGIREITVRSMMGFLSGWWDKEEARWKFEYSSCPFGIQHIWWGVHIFDLVVIGMGLVGSGLAVWEVFVVEEREKLKKA
ncbi:uncharacterized protein LTR77_008769 [Saxophila tyrrhenica]|uniref:Calcineurin-like phosphoesterase domain-containing protein n=1 Tax=Saxophila tyrrhenica TaxID=1690608 RepID=A0AAV9P0N6_9PEZI|nr:hypothetical protein LTR77_008769 [Saxophila tyrrhenica]